MFARCLFSIAAALCVISALVPATSGVSQTTVTICDAVLFGCAVYFALMALIWEK